MTFRFDTLDTQTQTLDVYRGELDQKASNKNNSFSVSTVNTDAISKSRSLAIETLTLTQS